MRVTRKRWLALAGAALLATTTVFAAANAYADPGGTITGHVLDNGVPVPDVSVQIFSDGGSVFVPPTNTDADGAFTFANVPPAAYRVSYRLPGGNTFYANGATTFEDSDLIVVADGATVTLDEAVPPHGAITGRLSRADGSGVFAFVQAQSATASAFTTTDPNGNYSMPYLWEGTYRVLFHPTGAPEQYAHQKTEFLSADLFTVAAGANLTVDDTLIPTGFITGRVTDQGQPAPQFVHIQILNADAPFEQPVASTFTNPDGTYRVGVLPGTYKVKFSFSSLGISQYAHQKTDLASADRFTVAEGEEVVVDEAAVTPSTLRGRLTNADGTPAMGVFVSIQSGQQFYGAAVGPDGDWSASVLPGTYTVSFATALGTQWAFGKSSQAAADQIVVGSESTVEVNDVLRAPGSATFTATDNKTGAAITNFCVNHSSGGSCTTTGSLTVSALPGEFRAFVIAEDAQSYIPQEVIVNVASGQDTPVAVRLVKAATLTTVIKDAETGAPVVGACLHMVQTLNPITLTSQRTCSGPDGTLTVNGIRPGVYNGFVSVHDGLHGMQWVGLTRGTGAQATARLILLGEGKDATLPAIKLDRAGTLTGHVRDQATGNPLEFAFVGTASFSSGLGDAPPGAANTDAQGEYTIRDLGPYKWTFFFRRFGYASVFTGGTGDRFLSTGAKINVGQTTTYDQNMKVGTTLTGVVRLTDGTSPEFARVTMVHALSGDELDVSDISGAQPYELHVAAPLLVKLRIDGNFSSNWVGGADFLHARVFLVGTTSPQVQDVTIP